MKMKKRETYKLRKITLNSEYLSRGTFHCMQKRYIGYYCIAQPNNLPSYMKKVLSTQTRTQSKPCLFISTFPWILYFTETLKGKAFYQTCQTVQVSQLTLKPFFTNFLFRIQKILQTQALLKR